jgi:hypothetical protein
MFKLPEGCENIGKSSYLNLPYIGFTLFSPIKGRIDSLIQLNINIQKLVFLNN